MSGLPVMREAALWFALAAIFAIGADLALRPGERRRAGERTGRTIALPDGVDPVNLRRRRPLTHRLQGGVLMLAALVILLVLRTDLGL